MKSTYEKDPSSLPAKCPELRNLQVRYVATIGHLQGHNRTSEQGIEFRALSGVHLEYGQ